MQSQQPYPHMPGSLHTPSQSFSTYQDPSKLPDWVHPDVKENETLKNKLADHKFNPRDYADPLRPRPQLSAQYYPRGVTAETEKHLLEVMAKIKA